MDSLALSAQSIMHPSVSLKIANGTLNTLRVVRTNQTFHLWDRMPSVDGQRFVSLMATHIATDYTFTLDLPPIELVELFHTPTHTDTPNN